MARSGDFKTGDKGLLVLGDVGILVRVGRIYHCGQDYVMYLLNMIESRDVEAVWVSSCPFSSLRTSFFLSSNSSAPSSARLVTMGLPGSLP